MNGFGSACAEEEGGGGGGGGVRTSGTTRDSSAHRQSRAHRRAHARVIYEDVDRRPAERRLDSRPEGYRRLAVRQVHVHRKGRAPRCFDLAYDLFQLVRAAGGEDDGSTLGRELERDGAPDAAPGPGHDRCGPGRGGGQWYYPTCLPRPRDMQHNAPFLPASLPSDPAAGVARSAEPIDCSTRDGAMAGVGVFVYSCKVRQARRVTCAAVRQNLAGRFSRRENHQAILTVTPFRGDGEMPDDHRNTSLT